MMKWSKHRVLFRTVWRNGFWLRPTFGIVAALAISPVIRWIDRETGWKWFSFTPDGARGVLGALSASMLTFIIFVVTAILLVVQLASAQLTPRIIALTFERRRTRNVLTFFTFTFTYTIGVDSRVTDVVPQLPVALAVILNLAAISVFFYFANQLAVDLRPVSVLTGVAQAGKRVIMAVYPTAFDPARREQSGVRPAVPGTSRVVQHRGASGALLAFDLSRIVALACDADATVELLPQVGDFVSTGDLLFRVSPASSRLADKALTACVVVGLERTLEQDPRFAFRIIVDIANKGLSPAINDPTTAVLAIDQVHRLLLVVGSRHLDEGEARDASGRLRLVYGTPDWDDYVSLGVSEIRHYGTGSFQVARRMLAMLDHLMQMLPEPRHAPLRRELLLLERSVERAFADQEDRASAAVADAQGMGGSGPAEPASSAEEAAPKPG